MQQRFFFIAFFACLFAGRTQAQSWNLAGNGNTNSSSKLGTTTANPLNLTTNNKTRLVIDASGKIGVGTNAPVTLFHVGGFGAFGNRITSANATRALNLADTAAVMRILRIDPNNAPAVELLSRTSADGSNKAYWDMYAEPSDGSFRIRDRIGGGSGLDRLTINKKGYVGIGTSAPDYLFQVKSATAGTLMSAFSSYQGDDDRSAFVAYSVNHPGYGYGISAYGGYRAVYGEADAEDYSGPAFGIYGAAFGSLSASGTRYGLYARAYGGNIAYGVYASASNGAAYSAAGYFDGDVYADRYLSTSDRKFKQNIAPIQNTLSQIMKLKPSSYQFKRDDYKGMNLPSGNQIGLIADEVAQVFPELVQKAVKPASYDEKDRKKIISPEVEYQSVNYQGLIPVLVASTQEQQGQIEALKKENAELKERLTRIEALLTRNNTTTAVSLGYLEKPVPNPSNGNTTLRYEIPNGNSAAKLTFTNQQGQVVKELGINGKGAGQVNFNTAGLPAGTYTCSLWVDGQQAASQRLVVAR